MHRYRNRLPIYAAIWGMLALAALLVWGFDHL